MKNEQKSTIKMAEAIATILSSRDLIDNFKNVILKADAKAVDLDFAEVEFISRSAAHALLIMKEDLRRKLLNKKEVNFINANKDVENMLRIVAANRALPKKRAEFRAERVDIRSFISLL